jgi:Domain of unknown function (DUF397)
MADLAGVKWQRSTYCENSTCIEVGLVDGHVAVRDSKDRYGPVLFFTKTEWTAFLNGARNGEFDSLSGATSPR